MFEVWLPWAKIDPLVISFDYIILGFFDSIKFVIFRKSRGHVLELYAKAKSSLISQQVQFFNKKWKKTYNFTVPLYGWGLFVSEPLQGDSFLCVTKFQEFLIFIWLSKEGSKSESALSHPVFLSLGPLDWESSIQTARPLLVK